MLRLLSGARVRRRRRGGGAARRRRPAAISVSPQHGVPVGQGDGAEAEQVREVGVAQRQQVLGGEERRVGEDGGRRRAAGWRWSGSATASKPAVAAPQAARARSSAARGGDVSSRWGGAPPRKRSRTGANIDIGVGLDRRAPGGPGLGRRRSRARARGPRRPAPGSRARCGRRRRRAARAPRPRPPPGRRGWEAPPRPRGRAGGRRRGTRRRGPGRRCRRGRRGRSAASSTLRQIGPTVSKRGRSGTTPSSGSSPCVVLSPTRSFQAAGIRTEPAVSEPIAAGGEAEGDRGGGAGRGAAGRERGVVDVGRAWRSPGSARGTVKASSVRWVLPRQTRPARGGGGEDRGVAVGDAAGEQRRARLGGDAGGVEVVLPAQRHAVERAAAEARAGARGGGVGLGPGALGRGAGVDAGGVGMGLDRGEEGVGERARVDRAGGDAAAERPPPSSCARLRASLAPLARRQASRAPAAGQSGSAADNCRPWRTRARS